MLLYAFKGTSDRKMSRQRSKSKPMSPEDYRKIEEDLQRQLQSGRVQQQGISQFSAMHDIMTGSFGKSLTIAEFYNLYIIVKMKEFYIKKCDVMLM